MSQAERECNSANVTPKWLEPSVANSTTTGLSGASAMVVSRDARVAAANRSILRVAMIWTTTPNSSEKGVWFAARERIATAERP
jgi:hypothetical protein